jgi:hypothetical protein
MKIKLAYWNESALSAYLNPSPFPIHASERYVQALNVEIGHLQENQTITENLAGVSTYTEQIK